MPSLRALSSKSTGFAPASCSQLRFLLFRCGLTAIRNPTTAITTGYFRAFMERRGMKQVAATLALASLLLWSLIGPTHVMAQNNHGHENDSVSALELASGGFGAAIVVGGAAYLILRRRVRPAK